MTRTSAGPNHRFGGDWTSRKLAVIAAYLRSYTTALKHQPFKTAFIDAFAGSGYRQAARGDGGIASGHLFPDLAEQAPQALLDGSARLALQTDPRFDKYIFVERNAKRCASLKQLKVEFPTLAADIDVRKQEANGALRDLCDKDWQGHRAVLFLDPYGLQVEWTTIEAVAATRAIDMWLLFPLGIGVNRLVTRSGEIPEPWRRKLDVLLGTETWYEEFYRVETMPDLLADDRERVVKASMATIGGYFTTRLRTAFAGVAEPGVLRNSVNNPLYLLGFASGSPRGQTIALKIANHLLKELR